MDESQPEQTPAPKRSRGRPTLHIKPGKEISATLPIPMIRDLDKLAAGEAHVPGRKKMRSQALIWLWEYWKLKEGR